MGEIIKSKSIYTGESQQEIKGRVNEVIVLLDSTDEEGYGVYLSYPWSDVDSHTISFGHGYMAEFMATLLFSAASNYYSHVLSKLPSDTDLNTVRINDMEFDDTWFKVTYQDLFLEDGVMIVDEESTNVDGFDKMMSFINKWKTEETAQLV